MFILNYVNKQQKFFIRWKVFFCDSSEVVGFFNAYRLITKNITLTSYKITYYCQIFIFYLLPVMTNLILTINQFWYRQLYQDFLLKKQKFLKFFLMYKSNLFGNQLLNQITYYFDVAKNTLYLTCLDRLMDTYILIEYIKCCSVE